MFGLSGKKLLILGGASVHLKLVTMAKELNVYTIVIDCLPPEESPAKMCADKHYEVDIFDIEKIIKIAKEENVDGVLSCFLDPCQRPYQTICEALGVPCYGTKEEFFLFTDKHAFKELCIKSNVDVIPEFTYEDVCQGKVQFPVYVKPVDSRGSRGQKVCYNLIDFKNAVLDARKESSTNDVVIEKYLKGANEFQVTYFVKYGIPHIVRFSDCYTGAESNGLEKVTLCSVTPSKLLKQYMDTANKNVECMIKNTGIEFGPVFMQGFEENGVFRMFDPGRRFPGADFELIFKRVFGFDLMKEMIYFALTGEYTDLVFPENASMLNNRKAALLFPTVRAGTVVSIGGLSQIMTDNHVVSYLPRYKIGDKVEWTFNVNQRFNEIDIIADNTAELIETVVNIKNILQVTDNEGRDMFYEWPNPNRIV